MADAGVLATLASELGVDMEGMARDAAKEALRVNTEEATQRGAFGVPSFWSCSAQQLFWGEARPRWCAPFSLPRPWPLTLVWLLVMQRAGPHPLHAASGGGRQGGLPRAPAGAAQCVDGAQDAHLLPRLCQPVVVYGEHAGAFVLVILRCVCTARPVLLLGAASLCA